MRRYFLAFAALGMWGLWLLIVPGLVESRLGIPSRAEALPCVPSVGFVAAVAGIYTAIAIATTIAAVIELRRG